MNETIKVRTARIKHKCEDCRRWTIAPGHRYEIHTVFPGHDVVCPDRPISLKRCIACAAASGVENVHAASACGTYCHGLIPCALPFGHVGDCSCRDCGVQATPASGS